MIARHYLVTGRVQGVFFRASARAEALRLGLVGWVSNLADGRVEAVAKGAPDALAAWETWLRQGPPRAAVEALTIDEHDVFDSDQFEIR